LLTRLGLCLLVALAACAPLALSDFQLYRLANVVIYAIALLGLNLLVGYNGQISLGHGAFYAIGAYVAAAIATCGVPLLAAVAAAGIVSLAAGFMFCLATVRLGTMHLAMATFALGAVLPIVVKHQSLETWTGGAQGLALEPPLAPLGLPLSADQWMYLLSLFILVLAMIAAANLVRGRIGRALIAIRDNPIAAEASGIPLVYAKSAAFGVSALLTGIAGALAAFSLRYVAPDLFGPFLSFGLLIGVAIGGFATLSGAIYGALFLQVIYLVVGVTARTLHTGSVYAIYGTVLILVILFLPGGIASLTFGARKARAKQV
jgi:branched-chain amino acid transport system permease protein